jgi:hypothetical protein
MAIDTNVQQEADRRVIEPMYTPYGKDDTYGQEIQTQQPVNTIGQSVSRLMNNFIGAAKSIGNTAITSLALGAGDTDKSLVNLPRKVQEGYSKVAEGVVPGYKAADDPILNALNGLYGLFDKNNAALEERIKDDGTASQVFGGAVRSIPMMVTAGMAGVGLAAKAGEAGSMAAKVAQMTPFAALSGSQYAGEAEKEGATYGQQIRYGILGGLSEALTEQPFVSSWIDRIGGKKAILNGTETLLQKWGKQGLDYLKDVGKEALQEAAVDPLTAMAKKSTFAPDTKVFDFTQMGQDAIGGAAMAVLLTALGLPAGAISRRIAEGMMKDGHIPTAEELNGLQERTALDAAQAAEYGGMDNVNKQYRTSARQQRLLPREPGSHYLELI